MASTYPQDMVPRDVNSYMTFLSRNELYQTEKTYATDFPVDELKGAKMTNHIFDIHPITFHDARKAKESFALDLNGFCYIKAKTSLQAEDATSERTELMQQYMQEIAGILRDKFPQYQEIKPMDFQVYPLLLTPVMVNAKMLQRFVGDIRLFLTVRSPEQNLPSRRQWPTRTFRAVELSCVWPMSFQIKSHITKIENLI